MKLNADSDLNPVTENLPQSLRSKIIRGLFWLVSGQFLVQVIRFGTSLILTRLLAPEAFGAMGLVQVFITSVELFSDVGLRQCVIHDRRGETTEFLNTVWTLQLIRGVLIWILTCIGAIPFALLYDIPELSWLLPIAGFSAVFRGMSSTSLMVASRRLHLHWFIKVELGSLMIGNTIMIAVAIATHSVIALSIGWVATQMAHAWLSYQRADQPRNWFRWDADTVASIVRFGRWSMMSSALTILQHRSDRLVLGKILDSGALGAYVIGSNLALMPMFMFARINSEIIQPSYARFRDLPPSQARSKLRQLRIGIVLAHVPMLTLLAFFAQPLVDFLYPSDLYRSGWYCSLIALAALTRVATDPGPLFPARGDARTHLQITVARTAAVLMSMAVGFWFGQRQGQAANGLIYGIIAAPLLSYPYQACLYRRIHAWLPEVDAIAIAPAIILVVIRATS